MKKDTTNQNPRKNKLLSKVDTSTLGVASSIINNTTDAVIVTDLDGIIILWNKGATQFSGYTREEVLGKNLSIVYIEEDMPQLGQSIDKVIQGENISNQERIIVK